MSDKQQTASEKKVLQRTEHVSLWKKRKANAEQKDGTLPDHRFHKRHFINLSGRIDSDTDTGKTASFIWGARSDVGLVREHNEDSYLVQAPLFCVCDGMGGAAAGEIASSIAVHTLAAAKIDHADEYALTDAINQANANIVEGVSKGVGKEGMGCTCTAAYLEKNQLAISHVGDSRAYLLHAGKLMRITHDHSYVEQLVNAGEITADEARVHPSRSIITQALGSNAEIEPDHFTISVCAGDRIILCSDGLSCMVPDQDIEMIALTTATPQEAADNLVSAALTEGGHDNVTVIVVDITDDQQHRQQKKSHKRLIITCVCAIITFLLAAIIGCVALIHSSYYLGTNQGNVAIYQGIDANIMGVSLSQAIETTDISLENLPESTRAALEEGVRVADKQSAEQAIDAYRHQIESQQITTTPQE